MEVIKKSKLSDSEEKQFRNLLKEGQKVQNQIFGLRKKPNEAPHVTDKRNALKKKKIKLHEQMRQFYK